MAPPYLCAGAISAASRGVVEAAAPAALIAPRRLPTPHLRASERQSPAVDLATIAATANQRLPAAKGAQEEAAALAVIEIATVLDAFVNPWTRSASGAIMPRQSCSGTVRARRRAKRLGSVGAAPGPMIDRTVAPAAQFCQRSSATQSASQITNPRVAPMGPQGLAPACPPRRRRANTPPSQPAKRSSIVQNAQRGG